MDDAVSVRPVSYDSVQANDRALTQWMENLPAELDLDEYRVARNLASPNTAIRRLGVQSVIIRTSYYHIRFTLHRPFASANNNLSTSPISGKTSSLDSSKTAQSLEIAVSAADKLITMVGQSRPDFLSNSALAVPGHMNWGPFHCFTAAMFFSFQLIAKPDQPGAGLFRASILKAKTTLEQARGSTVADKAYDILQALEPLYSLEFPQETPEARQAKQAQVLGTVRKLAFPYHDSRDPRRFADSPSGRGTMSSPANSSSVSPPLGMVSALPQSYDTLQTHNISSVRNTPNQPSLSTLYQPMNQTHTDSSASQSQQSLSPSALSNAQSFSMTSYAMAQPQMYSDNSNTRYTPYIHPVDEATMWGASVGFGQGEWAQFLNGLRPEVVLSPSSAVTRI